MIWEAIALDVNTGVEFLRKMPGIRKVILFGHSGGAATLSFYQAVAEKGIASCSAPQKLTSFITTGGLWTSAGQVHVATHDSTISTFGFPLERY